MDTTRDEQLTLKEITRRAPDTGGVISASASVNPPRGEGPCFAVHICDVAVDRDTGKPTITRYTTVQDAGRAIHPDYVEGQFQGGAVQGIGWALNEEYRYDAQGALVSDVMDGGPADDAGIRSGDVIVSIDGQDGFVATAHVVELAWINRDDGADSPYVAELTQSDGDEYDLLWGDLVQIRSRGADTCHVQARGFSGRVATGRLSETPLLEVYFVDVGQGDGVLVRTPEGRSSSRRS